QVLGFAIDFERGDGHGADGAMEDFFKVELAVAVAIDLVIVPDHGRVGIVADDIALLRFNGFQPFVRDRRIGVLGVVHQLRADVAALGGVDATQVRFACTVLGVLAHAQVHQPVVNHRGGNDLVAGAAAAQDVFRFLGVGVELPEQLRLAVLALVGAEAVQVTVATGEHHLRHATQHAIGGRRPLTVQDVGARRLVGPDQLASVLIQADEAGGIGGGQVDVAFVHAVGGADKEQIANRRDRATAHVVLGDAQLFHHVVDPDDVGFVGGFRHFAGEGAIVFAVVEALSIQALHFATAGDEPQAFAFHQRRAADALQRPVVHAAGGQLFAAVLPEELAVALAEGQQAAQVDVGRVALQPAAAVIGAHVNLAAGDHRVAVGLRAQPRNPLDVFTGTSHPFAGFVVELADVPRLGQVLHRGSVVAGRRATARGPIVG